LQELAAASGPGSSIIFTALNEAVGAWLRSMGQARVWKFFCPDDLATYLAGAGGWQVVVQTTNVQEADALGVSLLQKTGDWRDEKGRSPQYYWVTARL
jgi:hypothetical protein